jgi:hypothetical protein
MGGSAACRYPVLMPSSLVNQDRHAGDSSAIAYLS